MSEILVFKTQLAPTREQAGLLASNAGAARYAYNALLAWTQAQYQAHKQDATQEKPSLTHQSLQKAWVNQVRETTTARDWYQECDSRAFRSGAEQLARAYQGAFRQGKGLPKFKAKGRTTDSYTTDHARLEARGTLLKLARVGLVRLHERLRAASWLLKCGAVLKAATITKEATGRFMVALRLEAPAHLALQFYRGKFARKGHGFAGVDLGLKEYATLSDGVVVSNPRFLRKREAKLARAQRALASKQVAAKRGQVKSRSCERQRVVVAQHHAKVRHARQEFTTKLARRLVSEYSTLAVESLAVSGMVRNHHLAKSISDASWGTFLGRLRYMAVRYGTRLVEVPRYYPSSKSCSACGTVKAKLSLAERVFECPDCGLSLDRDLNAAVNLRSWVVAHDGIMDALRCSESLNGGGATSPRAGGVAPKQGRPLGPAKASQGGGLRPCQEQPTVGHA